MDGGGDGGELVPCCVDSCEVVQLCFQEFFVGQEGCLEGAEGNLQVGAEYVQGGCIQEVH